MQLNKPNQKIPLKSVVFFGIRFNQHADFQKDIEAEKVCTGGGEFEDVIESEPLELA